MSTFDEPRILEGLQNLDSQSIGSIYDQYFSEVYRYVRYRINDDAIAEDITSDIFVRLLEAAHKNQGPQTSLKKSTSMPRSGISPTPNWKNDS